MSRFKSLQVNLQFCIRDTLLFYFKLLMHTNGSEAVLLHLWNKCRCTMNALLLLCEWYIQCVLFVSNDRMLRNAARVFSPLRYFRLFRFVSIHLNLNLLCWKVLTSHTSNYTSGQKTEMCSINDKDQMYRFRFTNLFSEASSFHFSSFFFMASWKVQC